MVHSISAFLSIELLTGNIKYLKPLQFFLVCTIGTEIYLHFVVPKLSTTILVPDVSVGDDVPTKICRKSAIHIFAN